MEDVERPVAWSADRLDTRLRQGRLGPDHLRALARELARFHAGARCDAEIARHGTCDALARRVRERCDALRRVWPASAEAARVGELEAHQLDLLDRLAGRIEARRESGRIRAGHGDLRLERVHVDPGSRVAWSRPRCGLAARAADVCADVASLSRQLAVHGRRDVAERWIAAYADAAQDYGIYPLVEFYEGLASWALAEEIARESAARLDPGDVERGLRAALSPELASPPPRIVVVDGLAATGRSTLAERIAAGLRAPVVAAGRAGDAGEVLQRVERVLESRRPVVIDGGFGSQAARAALRAVAAEHGLPFLFVECRTHDALLRRRLHGRDATLREAADGRWEPADELPGEARLVIDTSKHPEGNAVRIRQVLGRVLSQVRRAPTQQISAT